MIRASSPNRPQSRRHHRHPQTFYDDLALVMDMLAEVSLSHSAHAKAFRTDIGHRSVARNHSPFFVGEYLLVDAVTQPVFETFAAKGGRLSRPTFALCANR